MTQPNELRIGNLVKLKNRISGYSEFVYLLSVGNNYIDISISMTQSPHLNGVPTQVLFNNIDPIPLTEEWLMKAGFVQSYNDYIKENLTAENEYCESGEWNIYYKGALFEVIIKSVHQLQNLYFALTGQELNIEI